MHDNELLDLIRDDSSIGDLLVRFDFELARTANGPVEPVRLEGGESLEMIAGDASGGAFMAVGVVETGSTDSRPVVYVGSEGEGGLIATSLHDAIALVVGLSNIHDAMAFPFAHDGGTRLRDWLAQTDADIREDWPELDADRAQLRAALELPDAETLLESLHRCMAEERFRPIGVYSDERFDSMLKS